MKNQIQINSQVSNKFLISILEQLQKQNSIFTVSFVKKDGTKRNLNGMFNVKKHLHGGKLNYKPETAEKFFIIFDMKKKEYRAVNKETIFALKTNGVYYYVKCN